MARHQNNFLVSLVSEWWIYVLNLTPFASIFSYIYMCGSESTKLLNPNPIRIRIHETDLHLLFLKVLNRNLFLFTKKTVRIESFSLK